MPLRDIHCSDCGETTENCLVKMDEKPVCPVCLSERAAYLVAMHGGYHIKGNNSASARPNRAGSFKKGAS